MTSLGTLVQDVALATQGVSPAGVTGRLLASVGISLVPGGQAVSYPDGRRSASCVSIDFDVTRESRDEANHSGSHILLQEAERVGIPLTWAVCGMTAEKDPEPLEAILGAGPPHEVACHTYSHMRVDSASSEELELDFERWKSAVKVASPTTFVFPYNKMGNFETLHRLGFKTFRGEQRRICSPVTEEGLCNIPPVMYLSGRSSGTVATARRFIDLCIRYRSVFHLWTHPWNLSRGGNPSAYASNVLRPIFSYLKSKSDEGALALSTMAGLARLPAYPSPGSPS